MARDILKWMDGIKYCCMVGIRFIEASDLEIDISSYSSFLSGNRPFTYFSVPLLLYFSKQFNANTENKFDRQ